MCVDPIAFIGISVFGVDLREAGVTVPTMVVASQFYNRVTRKLRRPCADDLGQA
jgi:hypothetical protein